ncbi:MAG: S1 family peptidase, partial [Firmicutes bacterium]|nr:S1 family peptidase [Bacillota bacterium]
FPGISIGHYRITAGTFGAVVFDRETGEPLILSNNHVLANETNGRDGRSRVGDPVLQPGVADGGKLGDDTIARLERFVPVMGPGDDDGRFLCNMGRSLFDALRKPFAGGRAALRKVEPPAIQENIVDAAVALPIKDGLVNANILGIGLASGTAEAVPGMQVQKSGRTSGVTRGEVKVVQATVKVVMSGGGEYVFSDQIVTEAMSEPGDSGSLVLDDQCRAVGLLFAGSDVSTICNRIQNVLEALSVRI